MDKSVSVPSDKELIELANNLFRQFREGIYIDCVEDISAAFFVTLFEGLFSERLKTVIRKPITREDEIYNAQVVIDTLATEVIHDQLPHIRGLDIVEGNRITISNLLEIFQGLSEYLLQDIEFELSANNEDVRVDKSVVRGDKRVKSPVMDEELVRRELRWDEEPVAGHQIRHSDRGDNLNNHEDHSRREAWVPRNGVTNGVKDTRIQTTASDRQRDDGPIQSHRSTTTNARDFYKPTELDKVSQEIEAQKKHFVKDQNYNNVRTEKGVLTMTDLTDTEQPQPSRFHHVGVRPVVDPQVHVSTQSRTDREKRASGVPSGRTPHSFTHHHYHHYVAQSPRGLISSTASAALLTGHTHTKLTAAPAPSTITSNVQPVTVTSSIGNISGFSSSLPLPSKRQENINENCRFRATIGVPSSDKVGTVYSEKHTLFTQRPPHHRARPVSNVDRAPAEQSQPKGANSPTVSRDYQSSHRLNSPKAGQSREQTKGERPYEYVRRVKGLSSSYDNLQNLVSQTAALARRAVETSPIRLRAERETDLCASPFNTQVGRNADIPYRSRFGDILSREEGNLASDLNLPSHLQTRQTDLSTDSVPITSVSSPGKGVRKVSFLDDRSTSSSAEKSRSFHSSKEARVNVVKKKTRPKSSKISSTRRDISTEHGYLSDDEMESPVSPYRRRHHEVVEDVLSSDTEQHRYAVESKHRTKAKLGVTGQKKTGHNKQVNFTASTKKVTSTGVLTETRRFLNKENIAQSKKTQYLKDIYSEDYNDFVNEALDELGKTRTLAKETEAQYKKKVLSGGKKTKQKSVLKPKFKPLGVIPVIKKSRVSKPTVSTKVRKHSSSSGGLPQRRGSLTVDDEEDLLPLLLEEFPYLYLSESTWHELWRQGISQIDRLTRAYEEKKRRKSKAQEQMEEAEKKHMILTNIVKKQIEHTRRLREIKERQKQQIVFRNKVHEKRIQSSRARRYYDEYQVRMRAKMLKRRTKEEMIFKNLFKEGLDIQKDRIKEIRHYAREKRKTDAEKRQNEIDSLENYYRDQFEMLAEKVALERRDLVVRDTAQQKVLDQMKKELRKKMEKEIQNFQDQLFHDEDDAYFRQLDADRLKHELHMAKYQTKI